MLIAWLVTLLLPAMVWSQDRRPLFDGHSHYNQDVWEGLPPEKALAWLDDAGIRRSVISSTPTEGTERLFRAAPERIVPFLSPYRARTDRATWFDDPATLVHLRERLAQFPYRGIGEFHLFSHDAGTPVVDGMVTLARKHGLPLLAHVDEGTIRRLVTAAPDIPVIWAHAGFDVPTAQLDGLLGDHRNLYLELSFREGIAPGGDLAPAWRALFIRFPSRFLVGMDTYIPSRWAEVGELAEQARSWLDQLPDEVGDAVAHGNGERLFARGERMPSR